MNKKKVLIISLAVLDAAVVTFLFVVHIAMLVNVVGKTPEAVQEFAKGEGLFSFLAGNLTVYGVAFVIPLFLILAANIIGLVLYVKKATKKEKPVLEDLSASDKEVLMRELFQKLEAEKKEAEQKESEAEKKEPENKVELEKE